MKTVNVLGVNYSEKLGNVIIDDEFTSFDKAVLNHFAWNTSALDLKLVLNGKIRDARVVMNNGYRFTTTKPEAEAVSMEFYIESDAEEFKEIFSDSLIYLTQVGSIEDYPNTASICIMHY